MNDITNWYANLKKPSWAPAESVFGQVWSVLYIIIIAVNIYVVYLLLNNKVSWYIALPFWINLFFNLLFTPIQFGLRSNALACIDIFIVLFTIIWAMIVIWQYAPFATLLFIPYLVWVCIATVLQVSITYLNR